MKTKLLAEMIFGMVIHGIGTKTQIIERIASEIDAHHEPVSGTYHEPVSGTYKRVQEDRRMTDKDREEAKKIAGIFGFVLYGCGVLPESKCELIASEIARIRAEAIAEERRRGISAGKAWLGRCFADDGWPLEEDPTNENFEAALNNVAGEDE